MKEICVLGSFLLLCLSHFTSGGLVNVEGSRTYSMTYEQARQKCAERGASLATMDDLVRYYKSGHSECACGWIADRRAAYPMNVSSAGCGGRSGIIHCNGHLFNAFCYEGEVKKCLKPLGMENGTITWRQITASTVYKLLNWRWEPYLARLNQQGFINAWLPAHEDVEQYLQINLGRVMAITGILTQGVSRYTRAQYVSEFRVSFSKDGSNFYHRYSGKKRKVYKGNYDKHTAVRNVFDPPIEAQYFRFHPYSWHMHSPVRMELLGCTVEELDEAENLLFETEVFLNE